MVNQKKTFISLMAAMTLYCNQPIQAQATTNLQNKQTSTTFRNPVLWADVPDPDVIRVGDDFFLVSTTMHLMPGAPIMHSKDLVNWKTINYVFDSIKENSKYDLQDGTVYGRGQWATSIRYHNGTYYLYFSPNDVPYRGYVYTTKDPREKWTLQNRLPHFHDASLFFDDDNKAYVFYGTGQLRELKPDLSDVEPNGIDMKIFERDSSETGLLEGSRMLKHDGKYYLLMISWPANGKRRQVCYRADKITGPYEKRVILLDNFANFPYVGQGTIVDDGKGNWYGVIFQDRGGVGRVLTLSPCKWIDGWPIIGDKDGKVPAEMEKPVQGYYDGEIVSSDDFGGDNFCKPGEFSDKTLKLDWEWNHNPVNTAWSLSERPGWLRLKTSRIVDNVYLAPNTLSQRLEGPQCQGIVKIDISKMKDGDVAGISAFQGDAAMLSIKCEKGKKTLFAEKQSVEMSEKEKAVTHVAITPIASYPIKKNVIYLRMDADFRLNQDLANLYYSLDGKTWTLAIKDFKMVYDYRRLFMGTRFAIFNYATKQLGGHIDVDYFKYHKENNK